MLETEGSESLLCNLCKQKGILQVSLDLNFMTGDRLTFECRGHGRVHLSGYLLPDDEDDDISGLMGEEESEEEEEEDSGWAKESPEKQKKEKRKHEAPPEASSKKKKIKTGDDEEEEEEGDSDSLPEEESDLSEGEDDDDVEDEEDDDDDGEEESEEEDVETNQKQKQKSPNKQSPSKKTPVTNGIAPKDQKAKKSPGEKSPGAAGDKANALPKQKQVLENGVMIKDIKVGSGPFAKPGKKVSVYYMGRLKDNGKVFDKTVKGNGFQFKLGKGEVIKGWDIGLQGMRVGGKRTIHCPPDAAYGLKGVPPKIPPNSTLLFEVELKAVH